MIKLIIFDLDGPILDSFKAAREAVYAVAKKLSLFPPPLQNFILGWGYPGTVALKKLFPRIKDGEAKIFIETWAENEKQKKIPLVKGTEKTLAGVKKRGFLTALLTTRSHNLKLHFGGHGLEKYFDFFQSFDNPAVPKEKVHPNHIFHSSSKDGPSFFDNLTGWAGQRKISLKEAIFIDDTLVGLKLARKIGLAFLGVCTGPLNSRAKWRRYGNLEAKYVINSIAELPRWLEKNEGV